MNEKQELTQQERKFLLKLARKSIETAFDRTNPEVKEEELTEKLKEIRGCFVTLTKKGRLRGCIGHIIPQEPLYQSVINNARSASFRDFRFHPLGREELKDIHIEISVLTVPVDLEFNSPEDLLNKLIPHKDGVVLKIGPYQATYLPQVWEQLPDKKMFLDSLSQKAGLNADAWRGKNTKIQIYHVEAFEEELH